MTIKLPNIEKLSSKFKKIFPPTLVTLFLGIIIYLIFQSSHKIEDKISLSAAIIIGTIFMYLKEFNPKFQKFLTTKIMKKTSLIIAIIGIMFGIIISIIFIKSYIITNSIVQLIGGIIFGLGSILIILSEIHPKIFK
ncbi:MAG: hypothetical protein PF487_07185 [Bacteroidales bacterium]|jgi:VanZ family protein|nr:hypothetical protein [Bacteroidales bacterium]